MENEEKFTEEKDEREIDILIKEKFNEIDNLIKKREEEKTSKGKWFSKDKEETKNREEDKKSKAKWFSNYEP